jgi:transposase
MLRGMEAAEMQTRRAEWAERVGQWRRSGLTAKVFARMAGVNANSLTHWAWRLGREAHRAGAPAQAAGAMPAAAFVEITAAGSLDERFELELGNGRRLRIPARFEPAVLQRLLGVLEAAQ